MSTTSEHQRRRRLVMVRKWSFVQILLTELAPILGDCSAAAVTERRSREVFARLFVAHGSQVSLDHWQVSKLDFLRCKVSALAPFWWCDLLYVIRVSSKQPHGGHESGALAQMQQAMGLDRVQRSPQHWRLTCFSKSSYALFSNSNSSDLSFIAC